MSATVYVILGVGAGLIVLTLLVAFLVKRHRAHKEKDKEAATGTTATMDPSQQLSGISTIIRDFMVGDSLCFVMRHSIRSVYAQCERISTEDSCILGEPSHAYKLYVTRQTLRREQAIL
ncbi:unnamed protein product [Toxocara canis]|uniref:Secreted protein n=1 Tax=Toxocara canis TaxID=6265 RepID=A0A183U744_TOXCA|nr:unnamed protein product [Toxocara canis]